MVPRDQVIGPAPRGLAIPPSTRLFLLKISTAILFGILAFVGISYAVNLLWTSSPADTTPPAIRSISVSHVTESGAIVTWETNEPATSQVMIWDPSDVCTWTEPEETLVTNHSVTLSGLEPNATYHLTIISEDVEGNENTSERDLTTSAQADMTPPVISGVKVSSITDLTATITWKTNERATTQVEYGTTDAYGSTTPLDKELTRGHSARLTGLKSNKTYHFKVTSKDGGGNEAASETDQTFATLPPIPIGPEEGNRAPDFTLETVDNEELTLSDFRGKTVIVNFWATWCQPCVGEMPHFKAVYDNWSVDELAILAINLEESKATAKSFVDAEQLPFPVLLDLEGEVASEYDASGSIPWSFFIDGEGIIQHVQEGGFQSQEEIEGILESL